MANVAGAELQDADVAEEAEQTPARGRRRLVAMGGAALLALGLAGGGAWWLAGDTLGAMFGGGGEAVETVAPPVFVDLDDMVVNLSVAGERPQYLRIKITLEIAEQRLADRIQPMMPRVLDAFQVHLRELRPADIEGSAGLYRLKEELLRRINAAVYPGRVDAILFKELILQ